MFQRSFNLTLEEYKISATKLAQASGVREATISDFRNGKIDPKATTLESLIQALPREAKNFMLFKCFIAKLNDQDISLLLNAIASEIRSSSDNQIENQKEFHLEISQTPSSRSRVAC
jgi:transcriptional regulator with XRE-family HTH domain